MKLFVFVLLALFLAACTTTYTISKTSEDPTTVVIKKLALSDIAVKDLTAASADAVARADVVANQCWTGLIPVVAEVKALLKPANAPAPGLEPIGVFTTIQAVRDAKTDVNALGSLLLAKSGQVAKIRQEINMACGALWIDMKVGVVDLFSLVSGVAKP